MSQPEWFGPMDKLSWQLGQMAVLFDALMIFGASLLALALVALVIQLASLHQLLRAEKPKPRKASRQTLPIANQSSFNEFRRAALRATPVRRKPL